MHLKSEILMQKTEASAAATLQKQLNNKIGNLEQQVKNDHSGRSLIDPLLLIGFERILCPCFSYTVGDVQAIAGRERTSEGQADGV